MKLILILMALIFFSAVTFSQSLFRVIEVERSEIFGVKKDPKDNKTYYRIVSAPESAAFSPDYPFIFPPHIDTMEAINSLLKFKGDSRLCALPITNYNPLRSQLYSSEQDSYSLQVEALFIINQLIFSKPFNYSSYPVLSDKATYARCSVDGPVILKAYQDYEKWFEMMKRAGSRAIKDNPVHPLDGSSVRWF